MATKIRRAASEPYDADFVRWTEDQTAALRAGRLSDLDRPNLAEEIESLGEKDRRRLESRLAVLVMHLLRWRYQPDHRSGSWDSTIRTQRAEILQLLADSPSLLPGVAADVRETYDLAPRNAAAETALPLATFPTGCPFVVHRILTEEWLP